MASDSSLREALVARWFDTDDEHHEPVTDEQILARIENLVGEGWHAAGLQISARSKAERNAIRMPIPSRARCLELGAAFIENDLDEMRRRSIEMYDAAREREGWDGSQRPLTTSHEGDLMKAVEWATAAATLRAMAVETERG